MAPVLSTLMAALRNNKVGMVNIYGCCLLPGLVIKSRKKKELLEGEKADFSSRREKRSKVHTEPTRRCFTGSDHLISVFLKT